MDRNKIRERQGGDGLQHYLTREGNHDSRLDSWNVVLSVCVCCPFKDFSNWRLDAASEAFSVDER